MQCNVSKTQCLRMIRTGKSYNRHPPYLRLLCYYCGYITDTPVTTDEHSFSHLSVCVCVCVCVCVMRLYLRGVIVIILGRGGGGGGGVQAKRLRQGLALSWDTKVRSAWRQIHDRQKTSQVTYVTLVPRGNETLRRNARGTPSAMSSSES